MSPGMSIMLLADGVPTMLNWQKAFEIADYVVSGLRFKHGGPVYHNIIVGTLKIHLCPLHIGQVLMLPGAVSSEVLHDSSLRVALTVPEVVDTENWVISNLPFLLNQLVASLRCSHSH